MVVISLGVNAMSAGLGFVVLPVHIHEAMHTIVNVS